VHGHREGGVLVLSQPKDGGLSSIDGLQELVVPEDSAVVIGVKDKLAVCTKEGQ